MALCRMSTCPCLVQRETGSSVSIPRVGPLARKGIADLVVPGYTPVLSGDPARMPVLLPAKHSPARCRRSCRPTPLPPPLTGASLRDAASLGACRVPHRNMLIRPVRGRNGWRKRNTRAIREEGGPTGTDPWSSKVSSPGLSGAFAGYAVDLCSRYRRYRFRSGAAATRLRRWVPPKWISGSPARLIADHPSLP